MQRSDGTRAPELTPADRVAFVVGTWFGCGQSPKAPGTVGSLGAVPLHLLLIRLPLAYHCGAIVLITLLGTWASQRISDALGQEDPQRVVVDHEQRRAVFLGELLQPRERDHGVDRINLRRSRGSS